MNGSEVEKATLSCIIADQTLLHRAQSSGLIPDHFQSLRMQKLYKVLQGMNAEGGKIDLISLKDELDARGLLESVGGLDELVRLDQWFPDMSHFSEYVDRVQAGGVRQRVMDVGRRLANIPQDVSTTASVMEHVSRGYEEIVHLAKGQGHITTAEESVNALCLALEDDDWGAGLLTGFVGLDSILMGLRPHQLCIIAGRPGMGKTALSTNMLVHTAKAGTPCGIFSLEMAHQELMVRILAETSGVPSAAMRANALTKHDWSAIAQARQKVARWPLFIEDSGSLTVDSLCAQAQELVTNESIEILVIDYLQLIDIPIKGSRNDEVAYATRRFKQLAMQLNIPIVLLSQLSRKVEGRPDKRPNLADLRDSGAIEQDADIVLFVYRPGYYDEQAGKPDSTSGVTELIVQKNRSGGTGIAKAKWTPSITSFVNV